MSSVTCTTSTGVLPHCFWSRVTEQLRDWATGHINHKEHVDGYWIAVQGTIPPEITGTYYRNGPGTYKLGSQELAHPFDGHGFIISIAIKNGKAYARARFVETPEYKSEVSQQKILFRGSFGTQRPGGPRRNAFDIFMKNAANTSIVLWGGRLLALFEAAQPIAMDPTTLQTLGPDLLGGTVKPGASFHFGKVANRLSEGLFRALRIQGRKHGGESKLGGEAVTAHPRYDPDTGRLVFFKFQIRLSFNPLKDGPALLSGKKLPLKTVITFFELDKDGNEVCRLEHQIPGYTFLHDFALTPTHYIIVQNPVKLDPAPFLLGKVSAAASVKWIDHKAAEVHLLSRPIVEADAASQQCQALQQQQSAALRSDGDSTGQDAHDPCVSTPRNGVSDGNDSSDGAFRRSSKQHSQQAASRLFQQSGHRICEVEPGFVFHQGNSYYDSDTNCMVIICVRYDEFPDFSAQAAVQGRSYVEVDMAKQPVAQLWRYDINMADGSHQQQCLCRRAFEFPSVHPAYAGRKARYIYGGAALHPTQNLPVQSVARYDLQTGHMELWAKGSHYFMGEPQFIPRNKSDGPGLNPLEQRHTSDVGSHVHDSADQASSTSSSSAGSCDGIATGIQEDDGWILSVGFDAQLQRSELVLLDAADIEAGPIAVLPLASPVGYGIHGTWVPAYYGP
ncbi:TPA: hypothetical protein ACH3X1_003130 [Trebouxia sp. C0004]